MIEIIDYTDAHQAGFERLNRAWIERYFVMEPIDEKVLGNPGEHILQKGGHILLALYNGQLAGVVALMKAGEEVLEFSKMAVDEQYQHKGIGKKLSLAALEKARQMGARKVILYSNTRLQAAMVLYRNLGFYEVDMQGGHYQRSDIKMQFDLYPLSMVERMQLLESYGQAYEKITRVLQDFPKHMWTWKPTPQKWSIHENLLHLADSEANSYIRCRRLLAEPGSGVYGYDQDLWATRLEYHEQSVEDALELFRMLRQMSYRLVKNMPAASWEQQVTHSERGLISFSDWLQTYENHTHIGQMKRVFAAWQKQNAEL